MSSLSLIPSTRWESSLAPSRGRVSGAGDGPPRSHCKLPEQAGASPTPQPLGSPHTLGPEIKPPSPRAVLDPLRPRSPEPPPPPHPLLVTHATRLCRRLARSVPAISSVLRRLEKSRNLVVFIATFLALAGTLDAAKEVGVPGDIFFPPNFLTLSLILQLPELDREFSYEFRDLTEPVMLPGCVIIPGKDILHPLQDKKDEVNKCRDAGGVLADTFDKFEPEATKVLKRAEEGRPPVYSAGPPSWRVWLTVYR
ncbi:uncharacterized protein A4U43_C01F26190 [Asparagus officinalis]|uniref:Uncharacterized protein n=1 Tax=Asparagus officinalis TaxID=4686 RepID=A0A5P1FWB6_ASPOF|nr:uncharacterized protein A4U43_C01F26190 [Asparagus officinalis]